MKMKFIAFLSTYLFILNAFGGDIVVTSDANSYLFKINRGDFLYNKSMKRPKYASSGRDSGVYEAKEPMAYSTGKEIQVNVIDTSKEKGITNPISNYPSEGYQCLGTAFYKVSWPKGTKGDIAVKVNYSKVTGLSVKTATPGASIKEIKEAEYPYIKEKCSKWR